MVKIFEDNDFVSSEEDVSFCPGIVADADSLTSADVEYTQEEAPTKKLNLNYESGTYADYPSLADQFDKYPDTVKLGYPQVKVFSLKNPLQLDQYNELLKRTHPESAPDIVIVDNRVSEDFTVMVTFKKLTYLIPG